MNPLATLWFRALGGDKKKAVTSLVPQRPFEAAFEQETHARVMRQSSRAITQLKYHADSKYKHEWLRVQRPRLKKGASGAWWCVSEHTKPQHVTLSGVPIFVRVGTGDTPQEAYRSWENF